MKVKIYRTLMVMPAMEKNRAGREVRESEGGDGYVKGG